MNVHRTVFPKFDSPISISHQHNLVFLGSCFSEHISKKCHEHGFSVISNPLQITYNPHSLLRQSKYLLNDEIPEDSFFIKKENQFFHFDFHSLVNAPSKIEFLNIIKSQKERVRLHLNKPHILFLTLGTAWVHEHRTLQSIVSNCHKFPKDTFKKRLLNVQEICTALHEIHQSFTELSSIELVITVSPVRHIKDGFIENQRSKSRLIEAVHTLVEQNDHIHYFPAYELMMDDLRDYRYFKEDMVHPNSTAVEYIWSYFQHAFFDKKTQDIANQSHKIFQRLRHVPFQPNSESHQKFIEKTIKLKEQLKSEHPEVQLPM